MWLAFPCIFFGCLQKPVALKFKLFGPHSSNASFQSEGLLKSRYSVLLCLGGLSSLPGEVEELIFYTDSSEWFTWLKHLFSCWPRCHNSRIHHSGYVHFNCACDTCKAFYKEKSGFCSTCHSLCIDMNKRNLVKHFVGGIWLCLIITAWVLLGLERRESNPTDFKKNKPAQFGFGGDAEMVGALLETLPV